MYSNYLPSSISLYVTYDCQLVCKHCFLTQSKLLNNHRLDKITIKKIIDDAANNNVFMMVISGGDPFLHPDIFEILRYVRKKNILPLIGASGIDLTNDFLIRIKNLNIPCIQVSLDGSSEIENDHLRGKGTFDIISKSIDRIQKHQIHANLAFSMHNKNIKHLNNILDFAVANNVYRIKVDFWQPYKDCNTNGYHELSTLEKSFVLRECSKVCSNQRNKDYITIPGYDVVTGKKLEHRRHQPLSIGADGDISLGEFGKSIGNVHNDLPSELYSKTISQMRINALINIVKLEIKNNNVSEICELPRHKLHQNGIIILKDNEYTIMVNSDLNHFLKWFTILHEIGHIKTNTVVSNTELKYDKNTEKIVNYWAINKISCILTKSFLHDAMNAAKSEHDLYELISNKLEYNIINY